MNSIKSASQVLQRTSEYLSNQVIVEQPAWYRVLARNPPRHAFTKSIRKDHLEQLQKDKPRLEKNASSGSILLRPRKLQFVEDELRTLFYKQHPWELADGKIMVENESTIATQYDWSRLAQFTKKLDGESVVQRALYLVNNDSKSLLEAYEQAKYEYYQLKIQQETETAVAREQGEMFGAVYAATHNSRGVAEEDRAIQEWKADAARHTEVLRAKRSDNGSASEAEAPEELTEDDVLALAFGKKE